MPVCYFRAPLEYHDDVVASTVFLFIERRIRMLPQIIADDHPRPVEVHSSIEMLDSDPGAETADSKPRCFFLLSPDVIFFEINSQNYS